jgi:hypothetical protein
MPISPPRSLCLHGHFGFMALATRQVSAGTSETEQGA